MSEKPFQKPADGVILAFKDHAAQGVPGSSAAAESGTDLARFAQDVVALNSRSQDASRTPRCQVAPLESMQRGLKIKKKAAEEEPAADAPVDLRLYRKE